MAVTVRIPTILRTYTDGSSEVVLEPTPATVSDTLTALEAQAPGISARVLDEDGKLRRFVNVFVDEEDVRFLDGLNSEVTDKAVISIIPAVAGG